MYTYIDKPKEYVYFQNYYVQNRTQKDISIFCYNFLRGTITIYYSYETNYSY